MADEQHFMDKTINTSQGEVRIVIDLGAWLEDHDYFLTMLMSARDIPFDLENMASTDPMSVLASQIYDWEKDPVKVVQYVRNYYQKEADSASRDAWVLTATQLTEEFDFDPKPYPPPKASRGNWDRAMPSLPRNLDNPLERRLKQIYDLIGESQDTLREFNAATTGVFVEAERRSRKLDKNGFRNGSTRGGKPKKAVSVSVEPKAE